jgi:hypothetical protein
MSKTSNSHSSMLISHYTDIKVFFSSFFFFFSKAFFLSFDVHFLIILSIYIRFTPSHQFYYFVNLLRTFVVLVVLNFLYDFSFAQVTYMLLFPHVKYIESCKRKKKLYNTKSKTTHSHTYDYPFSLSHSLSLSLFTCMCLHIVSLVKMPQKKRFQSYSGLNW